MGVKVYFSCAEGAAKFFAPLKAICVQIFDLPHHQISDCEACPTINSGILGHAPPTKIS